ncbi:MAG: response regulator [Gemmatimonadota bacterium]|nr:response regulator [Gemmatimonadota bacterium]
MEERIRNSAILIVDDEPGNIRLLEKILERAEYPNVVSTTDSREAMTLFREHAPDLVLLDLNMPHVDGFAILEQLEREVPEDVYLPVLILSGSTDPETENQALGAGANDFVEKPFRPSEVLLRIHNLLQTRVLHLELRGHNEALEERVRARTIQLEEARLEVMRRLATAAEYRDDVTGHHAARVGRVSAAIARRLGLRGDDVEMLLMAAPLHDVGKIGIPDGILLKPGPLTDDEWEIMKTHTTIGSSILSGGTHRALKLAEEICRTHHERWDGAGYPAGLAGEQIPLSGRIVAVADSFDTITHERAYKDATPVPEAVAEIRRCSGTRYDPRVVRAFFEVLRHEVERRAGANGATGSNGPPTRNGRPHARMNGALARAAREARAEAPRPASHG